LIVNAATSKSFVVKPATTVSIPVSGTQQYSAIETFSDGTTQDRTVASNWTSVNVPVGGAAVANITNAVGGVGGGLATGAAIGTATITATLGLQSATATLTVNAATSKSFVVKPATTVSIPVSGTQQYSAIETFSDGTTQDRTVASNWTSVNVPVGGAAVANITNAVGGVGGGLATGAAIGTATITATLGLQSATATLTVSVATPVSFTVSPATASITVTGGTQQFTALQTFSDGSTQDRTVASNWTSVNIPAGGAAVANITNAVGGIGGGLATGASSGMATITATLGLQSATAILTVTAPDPGFAGVAPTLVSAKTYGLIANAAMTIPSSPLAHIYGDIALTTTDSFTGFAFTGTMALPVSAYVTPATSPGINSTVRGNPLLIPQLVQDLNGAYTDLIGRAPEANALVPTQASVTGKFGGTFPSGNNDLSGLVLLPGVYKVGALAAGDTIGLSNAAVGPVVLDAQGNPDAVFVFQASDITTTTNSVVLQGGAQAKNIFWVMTASATIGNGTSSFFQGTVVAGTAITVNGANVEGRMLAKGTLTISAAGGTITVPK
jgi:hypothetical protein